MPLDNPRRHKWSYHFCYECGILIGRSAIAHTTIEALQIKLPTLMALREALQAGGTF